MFFFFSTAQNFTNFVDFEPPMKIKTSKSANMHGQYNKANIIRKIDIMVHSLCYIEEKNWLYGSRVVLTLTIVAK